MQPKVVAVIATADGGRSRAWRYFTVDAAPPDLGKSAASIAAMPEPLRRELRDPRIALKTPTLSISLVLPIFAATSSRTGPSLMDSTGASVCA